MYAEQAARSPIPPPPSNFVDALARLLRKEYGWHAWQERAALWVVWRLPHWLVYRCYIRVMANCTAGPGAVPVHKADFDVAARAWFERRGGDRSFRVR